MKSISINKLNEHFDEEVVISGFVDNIRNLQWVQFVIIRDDTSKVQVTIEKSEEKNKEMVELIENLPLESTVKITGKVVESPKVKLNGMEIIPESIEVTSKSEEEIPFNFKDLNNVKLIGAASESGSEVFEVKYFDDKAYLAQSPQFYKQMAMASGFNKIFEVAPVFRAENSNTSRHATEFTSFDVEMSYIDSFEDVMDLEAELIAYTFDKISKKYKDKIKEVFNMDIVVPKLPFPRLSLSDIYKELEERYNYKVDDSEKTDLTTEAERLCYKLSKDKFNHEFLFVTDYPADKRAFYHMRDKNGLLLGYDLIWRGVEISSGEKRVHRYEEI